MDGRVWLSFAQFPSQRIVGQSGVCMIPFPPTYSEIVSMLSGPTNGHYRHPVHNLRHPERDENSAGVLESGGWMQNLS